ncbi:hypothetical protein ACSLOO_28195, partial [Klebsiella pneumoniae]
PELPGNGKGPMQLALSDGLPLSMVAVLLVLKMVVILAVLRGGGIARKIWLINHEATIREKRG